MRTNDNAQPAKRTPTYRVGDLVDDGVEGISRLPLPLGCAARPTCALPLLATVARFVLRIIIPEVIIVLLIVIPVYRARFLRFRPLWLGRGGDILWSDRRTRVE